MKCRFDFTVRRGWTYAEADEFQKTWAEKMGTEKDGLGLVLFSEMKPVVTLGRREALSRQSLWATDQDFQNRGISVYWTGDQTGRGGLATYHGPGQWVIFPIIRVANFGEGAREVVEGILKTTKSALDSIGVKSEIRLGCELGLWSQKGKIASLGIRIRNQVVLHGISVNFFKTPESFYGLNPCGLQAQIDFAESQIGENALKEFESFPQTWLGQFQS